MWLPCCGPWPLAESLLGGSCSSRIPVRGWENGTERALRNKSLFGFLCSQSLPASAGLRPSQLHGTVKIHQLQQQSTEASLKASLAAAGATNRSRCRGRGTSTLQQTLPASRTSEPLHILALSTQLVPANCSSSVICSTARPVPTTNEDDRVVCSTRIRVLPSKRTPRARQRGIFAMFAQFSCIVLCSGRIPPREIRPLRDPMPAPTRNPAMPRRLARTNCQAAQCIKKNTPPNS